MRTCCAWIGRALCSFALACTLLVLLGLLTWLGTLEQVDHGLFEVQRKYFESYVLLHDFGPISLPLPGANLVLCLLFVNLIAGGVVRLRKGRATAGILIAHLGIAFMLVAGFVKTYHSEDGHVTLFEGQRASHFQSYYRWEIAVLEPLGGTRVREHTFPEELFADAQSAEPVRLSSPELPFELEVSRFAANCRPLPKGPMFEVDVPVIDGVFLKSSERERETEANIAGAYVAAVDEAGARREGILWGAEAQPWSAEVAGRSWAITLRKERYPMPFTLALDDFIKEDHPRIDMPKSFASEVQVVEGASSRPVRISMNEPLRDGGLVVYQASWGPSNARLGDPLFSTFAVVRNPADRFPLYACIVIAVGLAAHFLRKLALHVRAEARRA